MFSFHFLQAPAQQLHQTLEEKKPDATLTTKGCGCAYFAFTATEGTLRADIHDNTISVSVCWSRRSRLNRETRRAYFVTGDGVTTKNKTRRPRRARANPTSVCVFVCLCRGDHCGHSHSYTERGRCLLQSISNYDIEQATVE